METGRQVTVVCIHPLVISKVSTRATDCLRNGPCNKAQSFTQLLDIDLTFSLSYTGPVNVKTSFLSLIILPSFCNLRQQTPSKIFLPRTPTHRLPNHLFKHRLTHPQPSHSISNTDPVKWRGSCSGMPLELMSSTWYMAYYDLGITGFVVNFLTAPLLFTLSFEILSNTISPCT